MRFYGLKLHASAFPGIRKVPWAGLGIWTVKVEKRYGVYADFKVFYKQVTG
jgi:hypothetical protein